MNLAVAESERTSSPPMQSASLLSEPPPPMRACNCGYVHAGCCMLAPYGGVMFPCDARPVVWRVSVRNAWERFVCASCSDDVLAVAKRVGLVVGTVKR